MDHSQMIHIMTEQGMVMVHGGIPGWIFAFGVGAVILLSFVVVERRGLTTGEGFRINLSQSPLARRLLKKRWFQFAFQAPVLVGFLFVCYAGLFGNFANNIAPVVVWTIWWAALIFAVALFGNAWCFVCPWDALANLASRLSFWKKKESLSMGLKPPAIFKTVYPALVLFIGVTWFELGVDVTNNPRQTAVMGLLMAVGAMGMALVYEKKAFCRSVCLVGRTGGMYAMFAPFEIRANDRAACSGCTTLDCMKGNDKGYACPTGLAVPGMRENTYCTLCTECFKSCPTSVPAVKLRPFGRDLSRVYNPRMDEAWFSLTLFALTAFHGLSMTPVWENFQPGTTDMLGLIQRTLGTPKMATFTVGMVAIMAIPVLAHAFTTWWAHLWVNKPEVSYRKMFIAYAYAVLPVAMFYHLAHNAMHLFMEGPDLWPLLSDPMGTGANWFGTAHSHPGPLLSQNTVWYIQVGLILVGHVFGVVVAHRISRKLFEDKGAATRSLIPMLLFMVALSVTGLWLMSLDMNMRMGRM